MSPFLRSSTKADRSTSLSSPYRRLPPPKTDPGSCWVWWVGVVVLVLFCCWVFFCGGSFLWVFFGCLWGFFCGVFFFFWFVFLWCGLAASLRSVVPQEGLFRPPPNWVFVPFLKEFSFFRVPYPPFSSRPITDFCFFLAGYDAVVPAPTSCFLPINRRICVPFFLHRLDFSFFVPDEVSETSLHLLSGRVLTFHILDRRNPDSMYLPFNSGFPPGVDPNFSPVHWSDSELLARRPTPFAFFPTAYIWVVFLPLPYCSNLFLDENFQFLTAVAATRGSPQFFSHSFPISENHFFSRQLLSTFFPANDLKFCDRGSGGPAVRLISSSSGAESDFWFYGLLLPIGVAYEISLLCYVTLESRVPRPDNNSFLLLYRDLCAFPFSPHFTISLLCCSSASPDRWFRFLRDLVFPPRFDVGFFFPLLVAVTALPPLPARICALVISTFLRTWVVRSLHCEESISRVYELVFQPTIILQ